MFSSLTTGLRTFGFFGEIAAEVVEMLPTVFFASIGGSAVITAGLYLLGYIH